MSHVETGKVGVLNHLDVPYVPVADGPAYWEAITVHCAGMMMHHSPYLHSLYGIVPMPIILGKREMKPCSTGCP